MANLTFTELVAAAHKLPLAQKTALIETLHLPTVSNPTRAELIVEMDALRAAGVFAHVESSRNKYANPALDELSDEEVRNAIRAAATEWEKELDEYDSGED